MSKNVNEEFKEELRQFIINNYVHTVLEQFKGPKHQSIYQITLTMDLSLIIDTRPLLGSWIINFYPHFLISIHQIIYSIVKQMDIGYDDFICETKFISVPTFETAIHDPQYKLLLMQKHCGSLVHLKNCIIVGVDKPKNYLFLQEFQCKCSDKISIKGAHLIQRLQNQMNKENVCEECNGVRHEIEKKYKLCQKLQLYVSDLQPLNRKYNNLRQNLNNKYKHSFQLLDIYVEGNNVNKFNVGNQIYSLAYYTFNLSDQYRQNNTFILANEYCYAVTIDQYTAVQNKKYFQKLKLNYKFKQSQQIDTDENYNEDIKLFLDKSKRHYNYGKDNKNYIYEILNTIYYIIISFDYQQLKQHTLSNSLIMLKLSLLCSIFLENSSSLQYYLSPNLCQKSNLLIQRLEQEQIQRHLHIAIIYEDYEIIIDLIQNMIQNLDNCLVLPDCDEETFDYLIMSVAKNGILILKRMPTKGVQEKIKQILKGSPIIIMKDKKIEINCSIWCLFDIQDLKVKKSDFTYLNEKFPHATDSFDIVLDLAYSNLNYKQVRFNLIADYCEYLFKSSQTDNSNPFSTTIKKQPTADRSIHAPSSCYLLQKRTVDKIYNSDLETWINKLLTIDSSSLELIKKFYLKLRQNYYCTQHTLDSLLKISSSISMIRYFAYSQIDDNDGLYQYMITQMSTLPLTYSDAFLAILFVIETRINSLGPVGALFGSDTTNYLLNCLNPEFAFAKINLHQDDNETKDNMFENFVYIYEKLINFIY
ncbi:unnamed protein product [Paramecium primaurelia]|uniref:Uncharacterized protein n=1 Tax=Paramecium primaurelia TaxID=5886 RepID=A0A8S1MD69_PARPR|nr:unnamed protein product [Paramecium primaurelia]